MTRMDEALSLLNSMIVLAYKSGVQNTERKWDETRQSWADAQRKKQEVLDLIEGNANESQ